MEPSEAKKHKFYRGKGCSVCNNIGYTGRTGIYEILIMNEELRRAVVDKASAGEIREIALKYGMKTLRSDGLDKIFKGITTIEEVVRETTGYV